MKILYTCDNEGPAVMQLAELERNFTFTNTWCKGGPHQDSMRDELKSRGWYESDHINGRFLVLNLDKFGKHLTPQVLGTRP